MQFHPQKCHINHMTRAKRSRIPLSTYTLRGHDLGVVDSATYLGVNFQKDLGWDNHVDKISKRANRTLGFLKRNIRTNSQTCKERAYRAMVRPTLEYCCPVWDPYQQNHIRKLEMVQRRAARYVCNRYYNLSSATNMLQVLGWEALQERRAKLKLCMTYKIVHNIVAIPHYQYFQPAHHSDQRTRQNHPHCFFKPYASTNYYRHSFFIGVIPSWNSLPAAVAGAETLDSFKLGLSKLQIV